MRDADERFHREWLGLAQPVEGLVFSVPALADAQIAPKVRATITSELEEQLEDTEHGPALRDVRAFFESFLGYARPGMVVVRADLPPELSFYAPEGRQQIRPSFAIARGPFDAPSDDPFAQFEGATDEPEPEAREDGVSPFVALVWDLTTDAGATALTLDLDKSENETGPWRYPPTAKLERLLRHSGIPVGFLSNRRELRVVYAPTGESSAHLTFRFEDLKQRAGRPLVAALELIFHAQRTYGAASEFTFEGLLRESRLRQADVTKDLAAQVFEAVEILLEGFEHAGARDCVGDRMDWLRAALEEADDHLYQGILSVVLRLVFILYAEDQSLVPVQHPTYAEHMSVLGLYERLADDAGAHPESMHLRFGAYGRLIALFRAVFLGVQHEGVRLPPRRGKLFDPSAFPFLEGGLPGWTAAITLPEERAAVQLPSIDDDTVYRVLHRLVVFKGQRLSYRSLDVEQIGAVYESLMGYHVLRVESPAVRLGSDRVWAETGIVRAMKAADRKRFWKETCGLSMTAQERAEAAVKSAAEERALAEELAELAPGGKKEKLRHRAAAGRLVLQPGQERRRTGSHYTPRWLSEKVVKRTLEPILACLGENRTAAQILELKICDPAMGSGAFLVAACRLLAEEVVAAWDRSGERAALTEEHGDALLHARRLVAQRCLYGVDKNAAAVELAKLSLWLVTLSKELPFTFVDHALRHGDSLVGLDLEQIRSFHWEPKEQLETCRRALDDALEQALEHRDQLLALADKEDAESQREKQRLLEYAEQATARVRMIADVCIGGFFAMGTSKAREKERARRAGLVNQLLNGDESVCAELEALARAMTRPHSPFHWMLEFPEIFYEERPDPLEKGTVNRVAYMDAFVGNPPFLGGRHVSGSFGNSYRDWILARHPLTHGKGDLVVYFLRQVHALCGPHGTVGLIATDTITEGHSRVGGLQWLVNQGALIYYADPGLEWPGDASVSVAPCCFALGRAKEFVVSRSLGGLPVAQINSKLEPRPERPDAQRLVANKPLVSMGTQIYGQGFILDAAERDLLLAHNKKNGERIFPYLGGDEINTSPRLLFDRYVISFHDMTLEEASRWPDLVGIVRERVKPDRDRLRTDNASARVLREQWWRFQAHRPALYLALSEMDRCLVSAQVTKHVAFGFQPTDRIFSQKSVVVTLDACSSFSVLQSRLHEVWVRSHGSSLGGTLSYSPTVCFETFPFPWQGPSTKTEALEGIGKRLYETRAKFMVDTDQGLTKTYNALKDSSNDEPRVVELRRLHEEMDRAVLDAYGWSDIEVPPFCPKTDADRAALQEFEDEVIDRLYVLNAERAREEERLGLRSKKGKKKAAAKQRGKGGKGKASKSPDSQPADIDQGELF
ncbi:MAG: N-6 DNA methylase [Sandaracinaceae bacterium]|nr:N-6 DNA methylase [Sandaracinaceae bacterium]